MVLLTFFGVSIALLYWIIRRRTSPRGVWRTALSVGLPLGVVRASLACFGWFVVEHTSGPAQVPAFALAMLSWPEGMLLPRGGPGLTPPSTYFMLVILLVASTMLVVSILAALATRGRRSDHRAV